MKIYKEKEFKSPLYITILDNDVTLFVYDGYATGTDGKVYYPVMKEDNNGDGVVVGWKCEN